MTVRRTAAAVLAVAIASAVAFLSRVPSEFGAADALIRLSWRAEGASVEACRVRTAEELEALPVHMRSPRDCTRTPVPFALHVSVGGRPIVRDTVFPRGARGDQPVYVFRDLPIEAGRSALSVRFEPVPPEAADSPDQASAAGAAAVVPAPAAAASSATPTPAAASAAWEGEVELAAGEVALVTMDESGALFLRLPARR